MKRFVRAVAILVLACVALAASTFQVNEGEVAIVMRFGKPQHETGPGLHFKLPSPIDNVMYVDQRVRVLDPDSAEYLTKDKKNIVVDAFMAWRVVDAHRFAISLASTAAAETRLADTLKSVLNDVLSSQEFAVLVSAEPGAVTIKEINDTITARTSERAMQHFGVEVRLAAIKRVNFPGQNKDAVYRRMEADRKALARGYRSEGEELFEKIRAKTDRTEAEMLAEAERKAAEIKGDADAEVNRITADSRAKDPALWQFLQTLQAAESLYTEKTVIILPAEHELLRILAPPIVPAPPAPDPGR